MSEHIASSKWRSILSEETLVPISLVIVIISGVAWLSTISSDSLHNRETTSQLAQHMHDSDEILRDISSRLNRMEGKLDVLNEKHR